MLRRYAGQRYWRPEQLAPSSRVGLARHYVGVGSGRVLHDATGYGGHADLQDGASWALGVNLRRVAVDYDGTNDCAHTNYVPPKAFTWMAWFRARATGGYRCVISVGNPNYMLIAFDGTTASFWSRDAMGGTSLGVPSIVTDRWYHIALSRAGDSTSGGYVAHIDGRPTGTTANTGVWSTSNQVVIGGRDDGQGQWWNGQIDDVRLYERALSSAEILSIAHPWGGLTAMGGRGRFTSAATPIPVFMDYYRRLRG